MLHEKPVKYGPPGDDADETNAAWTGEKRRRKHLPQPSSSDAPAATAEGHQAPISDLLAKDHQGSVSDMPIVQAQNQALLPGMDSGEEEELFGPNVNLSMEDQVRYAEILLPNVRAPISQMTTMSWEDNVKVQMRQGRYRVAYYQAVKPESGRKLKHPDAYSEDEILHQSFFKHLQSDECFEWLFHTDDSWIPGLNDYQMIVLRNFMPGNVEPEYPDVDVYRELYHTYEMDAVYVKYYGEISKKIKWIEDFLDMDARSAEWREMKTRGWRQALRIASQLPLMTVSLAAFAYNEYIDELRDNASLKDLDLVYFEIWRLVVKENRDYIKAVEEVYAMDKFHMHRRAMKAELTGSPVFLTMKQMIYGIVKEGDIVANTEDDKARVLFREGVARLKTKNMMQYAEKKMEIAERLDLHKRTDISALQDFEGNTRFVSFAPEVSLKVLGNRNFLLHIDQPNEKR